MQETAVVVEAPAVAVDTLVVVVDTPGAITVVMTDTPVAITVVMAETPVAITVTVLATMGTLGTTGAHAMDLALDHLPLFIHRRPFTTMLSPVLIIAMILQVSTILVFPSLRSTTASRMNRVDPQAEPRTFVLGVCGGESIDDEGNGAALGAARLARMITTTGVNRSSSGARFRDSSRR
jgi:hypothetical protein